MLLSAGKICALDNAKPGLWLRRSAVSGRPYDFSPIRPQTVARATERRLPLAVCQLDIATPNPLEKIDMDHHRNSVLEARWLLAVPVSLLFTVLIAGLLLG
jgi:hypothetical protein